jgi:hypothetical protein
VRVEALCKLGGYGDTGDVVVQGNDVTEQMVAAKEGMMRCPWVNANALEVEC